MRVFFDTNVLVSAFATRGLCADVLRLVLAEHQVVTGEVGIDETLRALSRSIGLPERFVSEVEQLLRTWDIVADPADMPDVPIRDPKDLAVLASVLAARIDVFVTGDRDFLDIARDLPFKVVDPRGFWELHRHRKRGKS